MQRSEMKISFLSHAPTLFVCDSVAMLTLLFTLDRRNGEEVLSE